MIDNSFGAIGQKKKVVMGIFSQQPN